MYNMLFGVNQIAKLAVYMAGFEISEIERFRDAIVTEENGFHYVEILTRTGGANRSYYPNKKLFNSLQFIKCYDDSYDNTYSHFIFRVQNYFELNMDWNKVMKAQTRNNLNLKEMFEKEINEMGIKGSEANKRAQLIAQELESVINKEMNNSTSKSTEEQNRRKV